MKPNNQNKNFFRGLKNVFLFDKKGNGQQLESPITGVLRKGIRDRFIKFMKELGKDTQLRIALVGGGVFVSLGITAFPITNNNGTSNSSASIKNNWTSNSKLTASDLNNNFSSIIETLGNIPNWTKNGNNAVYTAGNVGIGTSSPFARLHLYGSSSPELILLESTTGSTELQFNQKNTDFLQIGIEGNSAGQRLGGTLANSGYLGTFSNRSLTFHTNSQVRGILTASGNFGIGTTSPVSQLHLYGGGQTSGNISTSSGLGGTLVLQDSGGGGGNGGAILFGAGQGFFAGIKGLLYSGQSNTAGAISFSTRNSVADSNLTERMRIIDSGNVGIGTTSPSYTLHINGSVAGTSAYNNLSDGRFKENVQNIFGALDKIERLRGVSYTWKQKENKDFKFKEGRDLGFIGQEVEKIIPEAVSKDDRGILSLAYSNIIPVLVEAIKELRRNQSEKNEDLSLRLRSVTETLQIVKDEYKELSSRYASLLDDRISLKKENTELKNQLTETQKQLSDLKKENADFKLSVMQQLKEIQENRYAKK